MQRILCIGLCGLPGAGKSRLAARLAERLDLRVVDRDAIRRAQFPLCAYSEDEKGAATDAALAAALVNCRLGFSSVVDGMTFAHRFERQRFAEEMRQAGAAFWVLHLDCPPDVCRERVAAQGDHSAGDRDAGLVDRVAERFQVPEGEGLRIDATLPPDDVLERAIRAVALLGEGTGAAR